MFKENHRVISISISVVIIFAILLAIYAVRSDREPNGEDDLAVEYKKIEKYLKTDDKKEKLQTNLVDENIVTIDTNIVYETKYSKCNHENIENVKSEQGMIGLNRKSFEEYMKINYPDWKMSMFSKEEVTLLNEKDTLCSQHFVVGEKDGKVAIFAIDENGKRIVHRIFKDATISTIREENQKRLKQGIIVDSEEEAIQVLEDFIS